MSDSNDTGKVIKSSSQRKRVQSILQLKYELSMSDRLNDDFDYFTKRLTNKEEIKNWLDSMGIANYDIINLAPSNLQNIVEKISEYQVNVYGNVNLSHKNLEFIPVKFYSIEGNFDISNNRLKTLLNSPIEIKGDFSCYQNELNDLLFSPLRVGGNYTCSYNKLKSLRGIIQVIDGNFDCSNNNLINLEGGPTSVKGNYFLSSNHNLIDLKGSPKTIKGDFDFSRCQVESLIRGPRAVFGNFDCSYNKLHTLENMPENIGGLFRCIKNDIKIYGFRALHTYYLSAQQNKKKLDLVIKQKNMFEELKPFYHKDVLYVRYNLKEGYDTLEDILEALFPETYKKSKGSHSKEYKY